MDSEKNLNLENLKIWRKVETTNPKYTQRFEYGKGKVLTTIDAYYQIKVATALWGPYGSSWGFKNISITQLEKTAVYKAVFYYPDGEFEIINSISLLERDFAKKLETDTLTKALSRLGFNADIFMGKFDDNRYVEKMQERFKSSTTKTDKKVNDNIKTQPQQSNNANSIVDALKQHGLDVIIQDNIYIVSGKNTFTKKDVIKSLGFQYSPEKKVWWRKIA